MFDHVKEYELMPELHNYIIETFEERADVIFNIFNNFNTINSVYSLGMRYILDKLENRMLDTISTTEDTSDVKLYIEEYIRKITVDFFKRLGLLIEFDRDLLTMENLEEFLNAFITILFLDPYNSRDVLNEVDIDDINNDEKLTSILSEYIVINEDVIYRMIKSVSDEFFDILKIHLKAKIHRGDDDVNLEDLKKVEPLILYSKDFGFCRVVKNGLYFGFTDFKLEDQLDNMYKILESYHSDPKEIAYEIFATNFLSKDKPIINGEAIEKYINLKPMLGDNYLGTLDNIIKIYDLLKEDIK